MTKNKKDSESEDYVVLDGIIKHNINIFERDYKQK